jgi:predicted transcriptional regulator
MFNTFFKGSVDELLNHVATAPKSEIDKVGNGNKRVSREEAIEMTMDDLKIPREKAEKIVTKIQLEEYHKIAQGLVEKGLLEITEYDEEFQPVYGVTEAGKKFASLS